jgi:NADPH:quinone reductase-like Zn-dependent oxidoreductase
MKAAVVNAFGEFPQYQDFQEPVADEGEVVVTMEAAGLHPIVKGMAAGSHYSGRASVPFIAGLDGVGRLENGKRVYYLSARAPFGTMAQQTIAMKAALIPLPDGLEPAQAAAIANPGMSAWLSLTLRAGLQAGETVLINGATGVAGQLAVQAARYLGAKKIVATGRNAEVLATLGADVTISLTDPDEAVTGALVAQMQDGGIDVIVDYLWGRPTELIMAALAKCFRREGSKRIRLVEVGAVAGNEIRLPASLLRSVDLHLSGSGFGSVPLNEIVAAIPNLFTLASQGHLKAQVETLPLSDVASAWERVEKGKRVVFSI